MTFLPILLSFIFYFKTVLNVTSRFDLLLAGTELLIWSLLLSLPFSLLLPLSNLPPTSSWALIVVQDLTSYHE